MADYKFYNPARPISKDSATLRALRKPKVCRVCGKKGTLYDHWSLICSNKCRYQDIKRKNIAKLLNKDV